MQHGSFSIVNIHSFIALVFTLAVLFGIKASLNWPLSASFYSSCCYLIFLLFGPTRYIIESGITGLGGVANNFISMSGWILYASPVTETLAFPGLDDFLLELLDFLVMHFHSSSLILRPHHPSRPLSEHISAVTAAHSRFYCVRKFYGLCHKTRHHRSGRNPWRRVENQPRPFSNFGTPWPKIGMIVLVLAMIAFTRDVPHLML